MAYVSGSQSVQGQALDITVVGCYNLKDKEWFTKQDPYVAMEYSGQKFRTRTDRDGGKSPSFNETFKIALIEGLREINATVWNSNTIERDDYIGSTKILLSKVIESGYDDTQWPLTDVRSRKSAGMLKLILHYAGAKTKPAKPEGTSYSQPAPAAPAGYYAQAPPASAPAYGAPQGYQPAAYPPPQGYQPALAYPSPQGYQPALAYPSPQGYQPALAYPSPQGGYWPPPPEVRAQPGNQGPPPALYPPGPAYGAAPPARPAYYPPAYGAAPSAPPYPITYPPPASSGYPPGGYTQWR